jgi:hypothetical protein
MKSWTALMLTALVSAQARHTGHIEEEGASRQELHKLADRFYTVLHNPIDTTSLPGDNVTSDIRQAAAKITGTGARGDGDAAAGPEGGLDAKRETGPSLPTAPRTPDNVNPHGLCVCRCRPSPACLHCLVYCELLTTLPIHAGFVISFHFSVSKTWLHTVILGTICQRFK